MKKLMLLFVAIALGTSACAGTRISTKSDTLIKRCSSNDNVDGRPTSTDAECRDNNP